MTDHAHTNCHVKDEFVPFVAACRLEYTGGASGPRGDRTVTCQDEDLADVVGNGQVRAQCA